MFHTIRQANALLNSFVACPTLRQNHMHFQSLDSVPIQFPQEQDYLATEDPKLWRDYTAVGFDISGEFLCSVKNDCWD